MEVNLKLEVRVKELNTDVKYRNLIGTLLYISSGQTSRSVLIT